MLTIILPRKKIEKEKKEEKKFSIQVLKNKRFHFKVSSLGKNKFLYFESVSFSLFFFFCKIELFKTLDIKRKNLKISKKEKEKKTIIILPSTLKQKNKYNKIMRERERGGGKITVKRHIKITKFCTKQIKPEDRNNN